MQEIDIFFKLVRDSKVPELNQFLKLKKKNSSTRSRSKSPLRLENTPSAKGKEKVKNNSENIT